MHRSRLDSPLMTLKIALRLIETDFDARFHLDDTSFMHRDQNGAKAKGVDLSLDKLLPLRVVDAG